MGIVFCAFKAFSSETDKTRQGPKIRLFPLKMGMNSP
jgi:hypothetical protein